MHAAIAAECAPIQVHAGVIVVRGRVQLAVVIRGVVKVSGWREERKEEVVGRAANRNVLHVREG
jgi:hypothetical protein